MVLLDSTDTRLRSIDFSGMQGCKLRSARITVKKYVAPLCLVRPYCIRRERYLSVNIGGHVRRRGRWASLQSAQPTGFDGHGNPLFLLSPAERSEIRFDGFPELARDGLVAGHHESVLVVFEIFAQRVVQAL